jgi:hypothetical protein
MSFEPIDVESALDGLRKALASQGGVEREYSESALQFASAAPRTADADEARRMARRHAEWFLLERPSDALGGAPAEWALHHLAELDAPELEESALHALLSSRCGVFEVTSVNAGEGAWVRDLGAGGEYPLHEPEASRELAPGDLIVGRLFAVGESLYSVSPAAGVFRNARLREALQRDVENLRLGRRGVLRLSQLELEVMFWGGGGFANAEPLTRAREFFARAGLGAVEIETLFQELAATPYEPGRWVHGVRDGLAVVLEKLAFETHVDLEQARRLLLEAWPALANPSPRAASNAAPQRKDAVRGDVRAAMEAFDRGREAGRDLEELFRELERDLELESEEIDPDAIDGAPAPDFPGVVAAMVQEYVWETEREQGPAAARAAAPLAKFAEFGENIGVFENLGAHELLLFTALWLPERGALSSAAEARAVLSALQRFCDWTQETQDIALGDAYREHIAGLELLLPRVIEANARRAGASSDPERGALYQLLTLEVGAARVRDRRGDELDVRLERGLAELLAPGDWLRMSVDDSGLAQVHCCYPPQVAALAP